MNSESLIKALTKLPSDAFDFDDVNFDETHDEIESVDSLGSCCNSPNQSSDGSLSSSEDVDSEYFIFPNKNKSSQNATTTKNESGESDVKMKRKLECKVKRNERERRRVRRLADGFRKLREVVPGNYKKLSKLDTLKRALDYMATLSDVLDTQHPIRFDQQFPETPYIKSERIQYANDFANYNHQAYQNTISYQPVPDWSMYPQQQQQQPEKHLQIPYMATNSHPFYEQQQFQRPYMMAYHPQPHC